MLLDEDALSFGVAMRAAMAISGVSH